MAASGVKKWAGVAAAGVAAVVVVRAALARFAAAQHRRVLVAVSGTIQDGFELRKNINYKAEGEATVEAVLIGTAVMRGVKMFFDIKDEGCREYDAKVPHRVNPAMVLTGRWSDANQYALYLVDERAALNALLGEPRLLTMVPDAIRIDLDDKDTSPEVAALARQFIAADGKSNTSQCAVLSVVPCYTSQNFFPAPPMEVSAQSSAGIRKSPRLLLFLLASAHTAWTTLLTTAALLLRCPPLLAQTRADGTRLTSFQASLAAFAGNTRSEPGSAEWNAAVAKALKKEREAIAASSGKKVKSPADHSEPRDDRLYGTDPSTARLSRRLSVAEFNAMAESAGIPHRCK